MAGAGLGAGWVGGRAHVAGCGGDGSNAEGKAVGKRVRVVRDGGFMTFAAGALRELQL